MMKNTMTKNSKCDEKLGPKMLNIRSEFLFIIVRLECFHTDENYRGEDAAQVNWGIWPENVENMMKNILIKNPKL